MIFIDSHCHLDFPDYAEGASEIVRRANEKGVKYMMSISTHISKFTAIAAIAEQNENVFCSLGVHPHHAAELEEQFTENDMQALAKHPKVVGIGECGLDYHYNYAPKDVAEQVFRKQIRVCLETGLPLIVHTREAEEDTVQVIESERAGAPLKVLLHCFSSSEKLADRGLELGYFFSFSGIVTFKKSLEVQAAAKKVPLERMLIETDAPFLAPPPYRGKRNEPAYVIHVAEKIAELKDISLREVADQTTKNFFSIFNKAIA